MPVDYEVGNSTDEDIDREGFEQDFTGTGGSGVGMGHFSENHELEYKGVRRIAARLAGWAGAFGA